MENWGQVIHITLPFRVLCLLPFGLFSFHFFDVSVLFPQCRHDRLLTVFPPGRELVNSPDVMGDVSIGDDLFRVIVHDVAVDIDRQVQLFSTSGNCCGCRSPCDLNIGHASLSAVPEQKLLHQVQFFWFLSVLLSHGIKNDRRFSSRKTIGLRSLASVLPATCEVLLLCRKSGYKNTGNAGKQSPENNEYSFVYKNENLLYCHHKYAFLFLMSVLYVFTHREG